MHTIAIVTLPKLKVLNTSLLSNRGAGDFRKKKVVFTFPPRYVSVLNSLTSLTFPSMRVLQLSAVFAVLAPFVVAIAIPKIHERSSELETLIANIKSSQLEALEAQTADLVKRGAKPTCHIGNVAIRRE